IVIGTPEIAPSSSRVTIGTTTSTYADADGVRHGGREPRYALTEDDALGYGSGRQHQREQRDRGAAELRRAKRQPGDACQSQDGADERASVQAFEALGGRQ